MKGIQKIKGDRISLAPFNKNDCEIYAQWLNEIDTSIYLSTLPIMITPESVIEYHTGASLQGDHIFGISILENESLIGSAGLQHIEPINRRAEIGIYIGDQKQRNQGHGTEAVLLLLDYGFQILNLNSIYLIPYSFNTRAIHCYEKCGFKLSGCLREARIINGRKYDQLYMDILANEYPGHRLKKQLDLLLAEE